MKSEIQNNEAELPFPKLMICDEKRFVVLMVENKTGVVIYAADTRSWKVGGRCSDWDMSRFKDFNGTVALSN